MKTHFHYLWVLAVCFSQIGMLNAQTPADELMMNKRNLCLATTYETGSWNQYWEGQLLRENGNIGTFSRQIIMPMFAYGITDKINFIAGAPHITTDATGGQMAGDKGWQDLSLALKGEWLKKQTGPGELSLLTTLGYSFPVSNYLSDYMPFSIGLKTRELSMRGIVNYRLANGLYARGAVAYLWRGQSKIERDYYYNDGSFYSEWMDVPNALNYHGTVGLWLFNQALKLEANYVGVKCVSGDDIRIYNTPQPTNKMAFDQVGFFAQYYFKNIKPIQGLGILAYYNQFINGRNMGKFENMGAGVTYQFKL